MQKQIPSDTEPWARRLSPRAAVALVRVASLVIIPACVAVTYLLFSLACSRNPLVAIRTDWPWVLLSWGGAHLFITLFDLLAGSAFDGPPRGWKRGPR